jgi:hypothetical protein
VSAHDDSAYRQALRITFEDVRRGLFRIRQTLGELGANEPAPTDLTELLAQRVKHLRQVVTAIAEKPIPIEPTLSPSLQIAYVAALDAVDRWLKADEAAAASALADRVVELIALELSWMPAPQQPPPTVASTPESGVGGGNRTGGEG